MKKRIFCLIMTAALLSMIAAAAPAAETGSLIDSPQIADAFSETISVTVSDAAGQEIAANAAGCYPNAAKLRITYSGAINGAQYVIFLQNADAAPTEGNLFYLDQQTATGSGVTFTVTPGGMLPAGDYYLAISGNGKTGITAKTTVASFRSYGTVRRGDTNEDGRINAKDVTMLQRHVAGGYGVVLDAAIADLNRDGKINAKDVTVLQRYVAGGYGVVLD